MHTLQDFSEALLAGMSTPGEQTTSSDLIYRVMSVWITCRANYLDLK
jgi:hypothetical protein